MTMIGDIAKLPASVADAAPARPQVSVATVGDYFALLKPRVMSLVVFTALVGLVVAPGTIHPVLGVHRAALHRGRRRRRRRAQHVVRRRHRRGDDAHRRPADPAPAASRRARRSAFGLTLAGRLGGDARPDGQLARGRAARLHDLLLRRRLHDVAEALDAAEHRHRRRRRRVPAGDRLGRGDRRRSRSSRCCCSSSSSSGRRRISGRWRCSAPTTTRAPACRCCRWSPAPRRRGGRSSLYSLLLAAGRRGAVAARLCRRSPMARSSLVAGALMVAFAWRVLRPRPRASAAAAPRGSCSPISILYLFVLFAVLLVESRLRASVAGRMAAMSDHGPTSPNRSCSPRSRSAAAARARSRSRSCSASWSCCSTSSRWSRDRRC